MPHTTIVYSISFFFQYFFLRSQYFFLSEHRGRKRNMKSWRANWSDTESPEPEPNSHSEDDEDAEKSPKRRRMSPTGLTCEIQGFDIDNGKITMANAVANQDEVALPVSKETRISGIFNINNSLNESLMDGSFVENEAVQDTEEKSEDICVTPETSVQQLVGDKQGHLDSGKNGVSGDNHGQSTNTPQSVFYSCSSEISTVPKPSGFTRDPCSSSRDAHANSTRETYASPENSLGAISSSSFVTPARSTRNSHAGQSTSEANGDKIFQTPISNAPKHFQTASVSRIKFQSPMEISYDGPPRSCNTTPRRRHCHVSMT